MAAAEQAAMAATDTLSAAGGKRVVTVAMAVMAVMAATAGLAATAGPVQKRLGSGMRERMVQMAR